MLTYKEMSDYGYKWSGMIPIDKEQALNYFKTTSVYLLYPDNTEALVENIEDIKNFDGIFGVEREDSSSKIVEDVKWFMFDDETKLVTNSEGFEHDLNFVTWAGDGHSFIVTDWTGKEYRIIVQEEPK